MEGVGKIYLLENRFKNFGGVENVSPQKGFKKIEGGQGIQKDPERKDPGGFWDRKNRGREIAEKVVPLIKCART